MTRPVPVTPMRSCAPLAAAQRGLITREQALAAGMARWAIANALASGTWVEVRRGVYRWASSPESWHQRALAAVVGRVQATAVSHRSAAFLHGLVPVAPEPLEVVVPYGSAWAGLSRVARVHRVQKPLAGGEVVSIDGLRVTSLPRTLADLAGPLAPGALAEVVDRAMRLRPSDASRTWLAQAIEEAVRDRRGAPKLRAAVAPWIADRHGARQLQSVLEAQVLRVLLAADMPAPLCQHEVVLPGGVHYFLDFAWPAARVALEVDGYAFHSDRRAFDKDRSRGNRLLVAGWQILHTTAGEIRSHPQSLVTALRDTLARRPPA
jgi:predicted transcriptional regulator of viral defense system